MQGSQGVQGTDGSFGGATFDYTYDTTTTAGDPGQGKVRLNSATENAATSMFIDDLDDNGSDLSTFLQTIDSVTSAIKGYVRIANRTDASQFLLFQISDLTDNTNWWTLSIASQASSTTAPFTNLEDIIVSFVTTGDKGVQGAQGVQGVQGVQGLQGLQGLQGGQGIVGTPSTVQGPQGGQGVTGAGTQGVQGVQGVQGLQGLQGGQGTVGTPSTVQGPQGPQSTQGVQGVQGTTGAGSSSGVPKIYQVVVNMTGGNIDTGGTPIASVLGPNGENKSALEALGWSFTATTNQRLTVGRPPGSQIQPLINIMTHAVNGVNVYSKAPTGQATGTFTAAQVLSSGNFTTLDVYGFTSGNTGAASPAATTITVTFGLIS